MILWFSLILMVCRSNATSCEFLAVNVFGMFIKSSRFLLRNSAVLYDGAYVLFVCFKRTNLKIAFRPTNTIYQQLTQKPRDHNPSGIYQLKCITCNNAYILVGQSGISMCWEAFFMLIYHKHNILISEQQVTDTNPLFDLAYISRDLQHHL